MGFSLIKGIIQLFEYSTSHYKNNHSNMEQKGVKAGRWNNISQL